MEKLKELFLAAEARNLELLLTRRDRKWNLALYRDSVLLVRSQSAEMADAVGIMANYLRGVSLIDVRA